MTIIKPLGFETIDVPGIEYIRIEPSGKSEFGVHVEIKIAGADESLSFGAQEFSTLVEGLADLLPHLRVMAIAYAAPDEKPGDVL